MIRPSSPIKRLFCAMLNERGLLRGRFVVLFLFGAALAGCVLGRFAA
ncbi:MULTISPECIES: hypothetical protein [unclassified Sphingobium]|nr:MULTISPECIES: hypothetical protein [unclassified Sphingobium]MCW2395860.1 hypothetical protein [Sphingobium sp. B8D3B]MCW2419376.1 hypothetical protein [Sphingobium sp. B8D3C]